MTQSRRRKAGQYGERPDVRLVPVSDLHPAEWNPRTISEPRFQQLCESLKADPEFLWRRPILANLKGETLAGNMRLRAAIHLGWSEVPAIVEDIDDETAKARALRDNNQWGDWQEDELAALLYDLNERDGNGGLGSLGFDQERLDALLASVSGLSVDPSPPTEFSEYDENIETESECPKCGYKWSGGSGSPGGST